MNKQTIWTLRFCAGYDFGIYLDRQFAKDMIESKIPYDTQKKMNELGSEVLKDFGTNHPEPYLFHEDTALVSQINIGGNGIWVATDRHNIDDLLQGKQELSRPVDYTSHNTDCSKDTFRLMRLFGLWVDYADVIRE